MYLIQGIRFGSWKVWRLNGALVDSLDHIYGKMPKLLEQYEWYSFQKYKSLVHAITFNIWQLFAEGEVNIVE